MNSKITCLTAHKSNPAMMTSIKIQRSDKFPFQIDCKHRISIENVVDVDMDQITHAMTL